jgi:hypothetical protein
MQSIKDLFIQVVNKGLESIQGVSDPTQKTLAYAELAKALAMTGRVGSAMMDSSEELTGKEALKEVPKAPKTQKTEETKVEAPKAETKAPKEVKKEAVKEDEISEEWNEEMLELKKDAIEALSKFREEYDDDSLNSAVGMFSEGQLESLDDISPLNVDAFLSFLGTLLEEAGE